MEIDEYKQDLILRRLSIEHILIIWLKGFTKIISRINHFFNNEI